MSVLIKGLKMPSGCRECIFATYYERSGSTWCNAMEKPLMEIPLALNHQPIKFDGRRPHCPLVEIPPHGRMIDADALAHTYYRHEFSSDMGDAIEILENYPTVIEAEEDQNEN